MVLEMLFLAWGKNESILRQLVGMPSNPRSSNGTDANPNENKTLSREGGDT